MTTCHCGEEIKPHDMGIEELTEAHSTRCCNCFDSWLSRPTDQDWYCKHCGEEE